MALVALLATSVQAQRHTGITADLPDSRTLKVQRKVEELFQRGDFDRAYFIYRNELVPTGDKYAQYMVGYMHHMGMGVDKDLVVASSWYRLSAERGTPQFIKVRDKILRGMSDAERRRSDQLFVELRREYSDIAILLAAIKRGVREMRTMTGSRLGGNSSALTVIEVHTLAQTQDSADYYQRVERELDRHLTRLSEIGGFQSLRTTDPARIDIDEIERLVNERLDAFPD